jgi:hypothetical protein
VSPENARHRFRLDLHIDPSQRILDRLLKLEREGKNPLDQLNRNDIMQLRVGNDRPFPLPFKVDQITYMKWDNRLGDVGGYEYDASKQEVIIRGGAGPLHDGAVGVFLEWLLELSKSGDLKQDGKLRVRPNQGK